MLELLAAAPEGGRIAVLGGDRLSGTRIGKAICARLALSGRAASRIDADVRHPDHGGAGAITLEYHAPALTRHGPAMVHPVRTGSGEGFGLRILGGIACLLRAARSDMCIITIPAGPWEGSRDFLLSVLEVIDPAFIVCDDPMDAMRLDGDPSAKPLSRDIRDGVAELARAYDAAAVPGMPAWNRL